MKRKIFLCVVVQCSSVYMCVQNVSKCFSICQVFSGTSCRIIFNIGTCKHKHSLAGLWSSSGKHVRVWYTHGLHQENMSVYGIHP